MKLSIIAFYLLGALVSGLATPEAPLGVHVFRPTLAAVFKQGVSSPVHCPATKGVVYRSSSGPDFSTLLSFSLPALPGKTCAIRFSNPQILSGSKRMQIFDLGGQVTCGARPFRNNYRCAMEVKKAGFAVVLDDVSCTFSCPSSATVLGFETVPAFDSVQITWAIASAGLVILAS